VSDLHFSELPPIARACEEDWMAVQEGYVNQLRLLWISSGCPPIFMAGDIFQKWNSSAYLISNVINWFRQMNIFSIPGNHDTPEHNYEQLKRSAYWTLVEAGSVCHIEVGHTVGEEILQVTAWPGGSVGPPQKPNSLCTQVALVHDYIWTKKTGYVGAPEENKLENYKKRLTDYDIAVFGDGHHPWMYNPKENKVLY
jgi:hypothetical protein